MTLETQAGLHVLVVDCGSAVSGVVRDALMRHGHFVTVAHSVSEALVQPAPDVLVADTEIEEISGIELFAMLRQEGRAPRAVLLSDGHTDAEERQARRVGVARILSKPFRIEQLVAAVEGRAEGCLPQPQPPEVSLRRTYAAVSSSVGDAARDVAAMAIQYEIGPICRARISSAVAEIVDNARKHAYVEEDGWIEVEVRADQSTVSVLITDDGVGVDADRLQEDVRRGTASGLCRAASLAEGLVIQGTPGLGTQILLDFSVLRSDFDDTRSIDLTDWDYFTPEIARRVLETIAEQKESYFDLPPALAVAVGRMLGGPRTPGQLSRR